VIAALGAVDNQGDADRLFLVGPDDLGLVLEPIEPGFQGGFTGHGAVQLRAVVGHSHFRSDPAGGLEAAELADQLGWSEPDGAVDREPLEPPLRSSWVRAARSVRW
jgi:hypothetical protein